MSELSDMQQVIKGSFLILLAVSGKLCGRNFKLSNTEVINR